MSEVDRLSNSGLYPALPIAEKRSRKEREAPGEDAARSGSKRPAAPAAPAVVPPAEDTSGSGAPRPPRSRIDEYA